MVNVTEKMIEAGKRELRCLGVSTYLTDEEVAGIYTAMHSAREVDGETVERVARAVRQARFERNGKGAVYDPDLPLHETELADARAAIAALEMGRE